MHARYKFFSKSNDAWNWRLFGLEEALHSLDDGLFPQNSSHDLISTIQRCNASPHGALALHSHMCARGLDTATVVGTYLVLAFADCGRLCHAQQVFEKLVRPVDSTWNFLISGYLTWGMPHEALSTYKAMRRDDSIQPSHQTYVVSLQACARLKDIQTGIELHSELSSGEFLNQSLLVGSALVDMYAKCGSIPRAQQVISYLPVRDVVTWTALISGSTDQGLHDAAFTDFEQMKCEGVFPNAFTFVCILKACCGEDALKKLHDIHAQIDCMQWLEKDVLLGNALVDTYCKCGKLASAHKVFDRLPIRDVVSWTTLIGGLVEHGQANRASACFEHMQFEGILPNIYTHVCYLRACGGMAATSKGQEIHSEIEKMGLLKGNLVVGGTLVDFYSKCGLLVDAKNVFDKLPFRDVVSWTSLMGGYAQHGHDEEALDFFQWMQFDGVIPTAATFVTVLKACGKLGAKEKGQEIHAEVERQGLFKSNYIVGHALIDMYIECGFVERGHELFDNLTTRDIVSWNMLINGYAEQGHDEAAMECFEEMKLNGVPPSAVTFSCVLKVCGMSGATHKGQELHAETERQRLLVVDLLVGSAVIDMYTKCGLLAIAKEVFDQLPVHDVMSWGALITGYVEHGRSAEALECVEVMQLDGVSLNAIIFLYTLKACGDLRDKATGSRIHAEMHRQGLVEGDVSVGNSLIDMYGHCGLLALAQEVFDMLPGRDRDSWALLISRYMEHGFHQEALECFKRMQLEGLISEDNSSCAFMLNTNEHAELSSSPEGFKGMLVNNTLVGMYAKSGQLGEARQIFDALQARDIVTWNTLLSGYADHGHGEEALKCLDEMRLAGISPDTITYVSSLKACASLNATATVDEICAEIERQALVGKDVFIGSALIKMYSTFGSLLKAQDVFDKYHVRNTVLWNVLLEGYAEHGHSNKTLEHFEKMQMEGIIPSASTFACCLRACASTGAVDKGMEMHAEIQRVGLLESYNSLGSALVDMYANCSLLGIAQEVFDGLRLHDVVSWTTLMVAHSHLGKDECIFAMFQEMHSEGIRPDPITFAVVLNACRHHGLVSKSFTFFEAMSKDYGIDPTLEHRICVVDLLGRVGFIEKAVTVIKKMPSSASSLMMWDCVLGACRHWGNLKFGKEAFKHAVCLDEKDAMAYVLMSHLCKGIDSKGHEGYL